METMYNIYVNYGWQAVVGLVLAILLIYNGKLIVKKLSNSMTTGLEAVGKKLTTEMSNQNKELINVVIAQQDKMLDHIINNKHNEVVNHNNMLEKRIQLSDEISQSLREIGLTHNSQRAFILEFHNSYQNLSGTPFAKYSCTYEWFDKGIEPLQFKCKDMPFSSLGHVVSAIFKSGNQQVQYSNMDDFAKDAPGLNALLRDERTKQVVYTAMYDRNNTMIGLLVLEYQSEPKSLNLNQLHIQAAELTSILNLRYKYLE